MQFEKSNTKQNLMTAFLRESGAFNEYTFYAEQAKKEGYEEVYNIFTKFAENEQAHAKVWFKLWHGIAGTVDNLIDAMDLENYERKVLYSSFSKTAKEEGFNDIANIIDLVAKVEGRHAQTYKQLAEKIKGDKMFCQDKAVKWKCLNCGHELTDECAPEICPLCYHPKAFFTQTGK